MTEKERRAIVTAEETITRVSNDLDMGQRKDQWQDALDEWAKETLPAESHRCITAWSDHIAEFICLRLSVPGDAPAAAIGGPPAVIDNHYLRIIRRRLVRLYAENPNDPALREQLSDEVDWVDAALSKTRSP